MKKYEKFLVCPNCKSPVCRKSALKVQKMGPTFTYCRRCGAKLTSVIGKALVKEKN